MRKNILFIMITGLMLTSCTKQVVRSQYLMGTTCEISVSGKNAQSLNKSVTKAFDEITRLEKIFSTYIPNSEVSIINAQKISQPRTTSKELAFLLKKSEQIKEETNGAFSITPKENGKLDFGGIAKGYAADRAVNILKQDNIQKGKLNFGGQLTVFGKHKKNRYLMVHPKEPGKVVGIFKLKNASASTSSQMRRSSLTSSETENHIINPKNRTPAEFKGSVTVVANTALEADAFSTALFVMGPKKGLSLADKRNICAKYIELKEDEIAMKQSSECHQYE